MHRVVFKRVILSMLGTTLGGRYQICRYLGGGGFGRTYLAHDQHLPGTPECVVKQLKPRINHPRAYDTACRLFNREAEVLYLLGEHDQIPRLFAHFEEQQEFYLVQEFVDGKVLSRTLRTGHRLNEADVIQLLKELLSILVFVHDQHVIHRDIKPTNLMRRNDGTLVMIDFGGVKQFSQDSTTEQTITTVAIGSAGYMPNEQLAGRPRYSSDVYAAGMVALRAVTGCSPSKLPENIRTGEICWRDRAPQVSDRFADILDRMTRYDFRERYATAKETLTAINDLEWHKDAMDSSSSEFPVSELPISGPMPLHFSPETVTSVVQPMRVARRPQPVSIPSPNPSQKTPSVPLPPVLLKHSASMKSEQLELPMSSRIPDWSDWLPEPHYPERSMQRLPKPLQQPTGHTAVTEPMTAVRKPLQSKSFIQRPTIETNHGQSPAISTQTLDRISMNHTPNRVNPETLTLTKDLHVSHDMEENQSEEERQRAQGDQYFQIQQYEEAIAHYTPLLEANPEDYILWFKKAMALEHLYRHEDAIACYQTVLKLQPQDYLAWSKLGKALETLERYDEAVDAYTQVLQIQPQNYWAWHDQGRAFEAAQHIETAIASYERAIQLKPDFQLAIESRKRLLSQLKQVDRLYHLQHYDEALQSCLETVETNPDDPLAWLMQGMTLENAQHYQDAAQAYDTVINLDPTDYLAWFRRGGVLEKLGQYADAAQSYRTVTQLQDDNYWAWNDLGRVLETLHQYDQSLAAYEKALALQETFEPALAGRDRVLRQFACTKN